MYFRDYETQVKRPFLTHEQALLRAHQLGLPTKGDEQQDIWVKAYRITDDNPAARSNDQYIVEGDVIEVRHQSYGNDTISTGNLYDPLDGQILIVEGYR